MTEISGKHDVHDAAPPLAAGRLRSQLLTGGRVDTVEQVVRRMLAVQAQDGRGARLAVRPRAAGPLAADVDLALTRDRTVVVSWLNRGTLHLVGADDYWWLHDLTTPPHETWNRRRLREEGVSEAHAERGVSVVAGAVASDGPLTRSQLRERLDDAGVPTAGQALHHVLVAATFAAGIVRGPVVDGRHAFVDAVSWLGARPAAIDEDDALGRLARRYLAGHGPATAADLARWAGVTLGRARRGLDAIADDVVPFDGDDSVVLVGTDDVMVPNGSSELLPTVLLGPFDPLMLGWASRAPFADPDVTVMTRNGIVLPVALVDGRVAALWRLVDGTITVSPTVAIAPPARSVLEADAAEVLAYLGLPGREVRWDA